MIFGDAPVTPDEVIQLLRAEVEIRVSRYMRPDGKGISPSWTRAVGDTLSELAKKHGGRCSRTVSKVLSHEGIPHVPLPAETGEFLLDFVWRTEDKTGMGRRAVMGVECEWQKKDDVLEDFEKLLYFKAPLKLLIFERRKRLHDALCNALSRFAQHVKGECYVFAEFSPGNRDGHTWNCDGYTYCVDQDGAVPRVERLQPLPLLAPH